MRHKKTSPNNNRNFGYEEYSFNRKKDAIEKTRSPKRKINNWAKAYEDKHIRSFEIDLDDE